MRGRIVAGAVGLGCAGLSVLAMLTLVGSETALAAPSGGGCGPRSDCQRPAGGIASDCEDATMNTRPGGSDAVKLTASVADGATVAPGQDITVRLSWDPSAWSGDELDMALACVQVKGGLDPDLSARERPSANDGSFEYRIHVPDNIKPGCDICVQGFLAGMGSDGGAQQVGSNEQCFMSGKPEPPTPPATQAPVPVTTPTTAARVPAEVPAEVAGSNVSRPAPAVPDPAAATQPAPVAELPRTGASGADVGTAGGGLMLALGGLAVIGGAGRRTRRRFDS
jgi:LPXTG-motif cell wall-anchored protein